MQALILAPPTDAWNFERNAFRQRGQRGDVVPSFPLPWRLRQRFVEILTQHVCVNAQAYPSEPRTRSTNLTVALLPSCPSRLLSS